MQFTDVGGGVIDSDYRGPAVVIFFNFSNRHFEVKEGKRFAQIMFQKLAQPVMSKVKTIEDSRTLCNQGAFGLSGDSTSIFPMLSQRI